LNINEVSTTRNEQEGVAIDATTLRATSFVNDEKTDIIHIDNQTIIIIILSVLLGLFICTAIAYFAFRGHIGQKLKKETSEQYIQRPPLSPILSVSSFQTQDDEENDRNLERLTLDTGDANISQLIKDEHEDETDESAENLFVAGTTTQGPDQDDKSVSSTEHILEGDGLAIAQTTKDESEGDGELMMRH